MAKEIANACVVESHLGEYMKELENRVGDILEELGREAVGNAKDNLYNSVSEFATGHLARETVFKVDPNENSVAIGTNVGYGVYVELGTGIYADNGKGRQTPWAWYDKDGNRHWTHGMKPKHYLKRAVTEHTDKYKEIIKSGLK